MNMCVIPLPLRLCVLPGATTTLSQVFSSPLTDDQIDAIMEALDADGDGSLTYNEFLNGFSVVDTSKQGEMKSS